MGRWVAKETVTTLREVLSNSSLFNTSHFLYLPMNEVWQLETKCVVLPVSDLDDVPEMAQQDGLSYALGMAAVQDVVANAKEQNTTVNLSQLLEAFLFYYDHDAFIKF